MTDYISRADAKKAVYLLGKRPQINEIWDCLDGLPSADAEPKWSCTANFVAEQLDRLRKMTDEERWDFFIKFFNPSADRPSVEIKECRPLCTEQKIAVEEFLNAPRMSEECAIELLQMTGWLQEHDKEIGRPSGEWLMFDGLYCSNCHYKLQTTGIPTYCPSCGAKMGGDGE